MEKATNVNRLERSDSDESIESSTDARINAFTPAEQKKLMWRIDVRLVLTLGFMYCVSLMDRTNLGIAVVAGMGVDLQLAVGFRYSTIVLVFFVTYVALQPPVTVVLRKVGPRIFLPAITMLWGATMITFAFITNWTTMIPLRLLLGVFEAGFFPGCAYLLSCWYMRYEQQKRYAVFFLIGSLSSAFSGILAYGFSHMSGLGNLGPGYGQHYGPTKANPTAPSGEMSGLAGWRWIFIMQGLLTCIVAAIGSITIADFPEKAAENSKSFALSLPWQNASSPLPTSSPPFGCSPYHTRGPIIILNACLGLVGLPLLGFAHGSAVRYFGVFLATTSCNANVPAILSYQANNVRGQWKRAFASATLVGAGGIGGIIGSTVFRAQDKPGYAPGITACIVACAGVVVITGFMDLKFHRANQRAAAGGKVIEGLGGFRYTL